MIEPESSDSVSSELTSDSQPDSLYVESGLEVLFVPNENIMQIN